METDILATSEITITLDSVGLAEAMQVLGWGLRYNIRIGMMEVSRPSHDAGAWRGVDDYSRAALTEAVAEGFCAEGRGKKPAPAVFSPARLDQSLHALADRQREDPFLTWLHSLPEWDGVKRLDSWLGALFVVSDSDWPLGSWASSSLLAGAVNRSLNPGCRHDEVPVLIGGQGLGKSSAIRKLLPTWADDWHSDGLSFSLDDRESLEAIEGSVIVEIPDMTGSGSGDADRIKAFVTRRVDKIRRKYRRDPELIPRRCVFVGSADRVSCLPPETGHRRWVPIRLAGARMPLAGMTAWMDDHREQLWSEARTAVAAGVDGTMPEGLWALQEQAVARSSPADLMREGVRNFLADLESNTFSLADLADSLSRTGLSLRTPRDRQSAASALRDMGCDRRLDSRSRRAVWTRPE